MAIGAVVARIITQYSDKGSKAAQRDINKLGKSFDKFADKAVKSFGIAAAASAALAVKIGVDSVKAAIADEKSQALLANSLRNTTGATDAVIASTEQWISKVQASYGEVDDNLRPALAKLAGVTGDLETAQKLLGVSLDVSAGGNVDLATATDAVVKAIQGQYRGLKSLGVPIDEATAKSKDLNKIIAITTKTFGGSAAVRAATFEYRMKRVGIALDEAKETLGNALLPAVERLFQTLTTKVIPALQTWLQENGEKLVAAFNEAIKAVVAFGFAVYKIFDFVSRNKNLFLSLGAIFTATFVAAKVIAFVQAVEKLVKAYQAIRAAAIGAAAAQAAATGGLSLTAAASGIAAFAATVGGLYIAIDKANGQLSKLDKSTNGLEFSFDGLNESSSNFLGDLKNMNINVGKLTASTAKLTKEQQKQILSEKSLAALAKLGIKPTTEQDPIQLEAARLNLLKQNSIQEAKRVADILAGVKAQLSANEAIARYSDLLQVVADNKVSTEEVAILAGKWGLSKEAVVAYISSVLLVSDGQISDAEVTNLAAQWGITKQQAETYLDFFAAINDGFLDDTEIDKLAKKWGFTNAQVLDYAKKISEGATPSDLWAVPGNAAAKSWQDALIALNAYNAAAGVKAQGVVAATNAGVSAGAGGGGAGGATEAATKIITGLTGGAGTTADSASAAAAAARAKAAAAAETARENARAALAAATAKAAAAAAAAAQASETARENRRSLLGLASGGIVTSPTIAMIGEAGPEAVIPLSQLGNTGSSINITVNNAGYVTSENDLVSTIRNALLQGQNNGQAVVKNAIII